MDFLFSLLWLGFGFLVFDLVGVVSLWFVLVAYRVLGFVWCFDLVISLF